MRGFGPRYRRSYDRALMIAIAPAQYVNARVALRLRLVPRRRPVDRG